MGKLRKKKKQQAKAFLEQLWKKKIY